jgi:hypothetical protein
LCIHLFGTLRILILRHGNYKATWTSQWNWILPKPQWALVYYIKSWKHSSSLLQILLDTSISEILRMLINVQYTLGLGIKPLCFLQSRGSNTRKYLKLFFRIKSSVSEICDRSWTPTLTAEFCKALSVFESRYLYVNCWVRLQLWNAIIVTTDFSLFAPRRYSSIEDQLTLWD